MFKLTPLYYARNKLKRVDHRVVIEVVLRRPTASVRDFCDKGCKKGEKDYTCCAAWQPDDK